jgi:hypothetical protein
MIIILYEVLFILLHLMTHVAPETLKAEGREVRPRLFTVETRVQYQVI